MNITKATEWVYDQDEQDEVDQDQLKAAFAALHGRQPGPDDRQAGLWSLCCAATPNCGTRPPTLRPGAQIRVKSPSSAFHDARGTVSHQVNASHIWAVHLGGFLGTVDFTANEMTVLS